MAGKTRVAPGIYKVGPGVYDLTVSTGRGVDGKYSQVTKRVRGSLQEAKEARALLLQDAKGPRAVPTTMAELHARYMATKTNLAPASQAQYAYLWAKLEPHIGTLLVTKVRALDLDHAYAEISATGVSQNTVRKCHKHAVALLARAVAWELVSRNVATKATPPAEKPYNPNVPNGDNVRTLVAAARKQETQFGSLVYVAATTGARRGELAGLRLCDWDPKAGTLRFVHQPTNEGDLAPLKTGRQRIVRLDPETVATLKAHVKAIEKLADECGGVVTPECFLFSPMPGNTEPYRKDGLTHRFDRLRKTTGIDCRLHDLRHAQATQLLANGVAPQVAAARLGQTVEVLISTYAHVDVEQEKRAAAAGALGA